MTDGRDPAWPSYPVLAFDPGTEVFEAMVAAADAGYDPKAAAERLDRLRLQAALYLAKHRSATASDLKLAREVIRRHLPKARSA